MQRGYAEALAHVLRDDEMRARTHWGIEVDDFENRDLMEFQHIAPKVTPVITNLYLNHALCFVSDEKLGKINQLMEKHGFWNVLSTPIDSPSEKAERIRGLAALGLVASCATGRDNTAHFLKELGFCLEDILANLWESYKVDGYPFGTDAPTSPAGDNGAVFTPLL